MVLVHDYGTCQWRTRALLRQQWERMRRGRLFRELYSHENRDSGSMFGVGHTDTATDATSPTTIHASTYTCGPMFIGMDAMRRHWLSEDGVLPRLLLCLHQRLVVGMQTWS